MSAAIELSAVGKRYEQLDEQAMLLRSLMPTARPTKRHVWALRNLNLRLNPGEALGVVGHNGAGKTTLLRLLAGVTSPTEGHVRVVGRIGPLISLGVGFHPELSGRENVQLNGMLLGLTARQVADRFDQIVEFAELQAFIDTPVKFYSSGMFMRLGFAVVAHTEPSILLIDEILAVGDAKFQLKCFDRLRSLQDSGASIVMVSHSMSMIRQICQRAVVIRGGRLAFGGGVEEAIAFHESQAGDDPLSTKQSVEFLNCALEGSMSNHVVANYDETVAIQATVRFLEETVDPVVLVGVRTTDGVFGGIDVTPVTQRWRTFKPGEETDIKIAFPARLSPGAYRIILEVKEATAVHALARRDDMTLTMSGSSECGGLIDLCAGVEWS